MLEMDYNNYTLGYSYDITLSDINIHTSGSHETIIGISSYQKINNEKSSNY
jgi:hypothetical protein